MADLRNVDQALEEILAQVRLLSSEQVPLLEALGRVLAEDVVSDVHLPPFPCAAMDGYAVCAEDIGEAAPNTPAALVVVGDIFAGRLPEVVVQPGQAARIMTGAALPDGADTVVPVESTDAQWGDEKDAPETGIRIYQRFAYGAHVRAAGSDLMAGQTVLKAGAALRPQEIGILAALGHAVVPVYRRPRVVILAQGDELVDVGEVLPPGRIRNTNSYTLAGLIRTYGGDAICLPVAPDSPDALRRLFAEALECRPDMIISSGGVSVGAADLVRSILSEMGSIAFWRVNLRPGKPLTYGHLQGVPFFGLPGNPVSAMVTFDVLVRPALLKQAGRRDKWPLTTAVVGETMRSDGRRSFVRVKLEYTDGQLIARHVEPQNSSALISMVLADGLLIVPENVTYIQAGLSLPVRLLREPESDIVLHYVTREEEGTAT